MSWKKKLSPPDVLFYQSTARCCSHLYKLLSHRQRTPSTNHLPSKDASHSKQFSSEEHRLRSYSPLFMVVKSLINRAVITNEAAFLGLLLRGKLYKMNEDCDQLEPTVPTIAPQSSVATTMCRSPRGSVECLQKAFEILGALVLEEPHCIHSRLPVVRVPVTCDDQYSIYDYQHLESIDIPGTTPNGSNSAPTPGTSPIHFPTCLWM